MNGKNVFWGLFFIAAAGLVAVHQLGYLAGITTLNLVITIFLIPILLKSIMKINFFGIFFSIAVFGILFADQLGISDFVPVHILIVATFLSIGFTLVFSKWASINWVIGIHNEEGLGEVVDTEDEEVVEFGVKLGSSIKYVNSKNLKQAKLTCSFGELQVYFDNTTVSEEGAVISVDVSFGELRMYIPKEWKVINGISATLAGVEEKNKRNGEETATVKLTGRVNMGEVEIIYV